MSRLTVRQAVGIIGVVATVGTIGVVAGSWTAGATDTTSSAARSACVGSFRFDLTFGGPGGPSRPYVGTLISDRTAIVSPPGAVSTFIPGGADVEFSSSLHGAWRPNGRKACHLVVEQIDAGIDGAISGSSRSTLSVMVDGDRVTVDGTAATFDATGAPVASGIPISGLGSRITVEP